MKIERGDKRKELKDDLAVLSKQSGVLKCQLFCWFGKFFSCLSLLFSFPEEWQGLDVASAVCCRDLMSGAADLGLARLAGI